MATRFLTGLDSNFNEQMRGIAGRAGQGMMTGIGGSIAGLGKAMGNERLAGADFRPEGVKLKERFAQLTGSKDPNDRQELLQIMGKMGASPDVIAKYQMQFAAEDKAEQSIELQGTQREKFANYLDRTYPGKGYGALALQGVITPANMKDFIKETTSADRERFNVLNEATGKMEIISQNKDGTDRKVEGIAKAAATPSPIPVINEGASTVAFVDPLTQQQIGKTVSIKSEEQLEQEREEARVKLETRNMALTTGRGNLASKTAGIRQAIEGLQSTGAGALFGSRFEAKLQESFPIAYGSLVQKDEYLNIVDLVASIKSDQALSVIAEMKSQSRTGATGLGNTNVMEIALLQDEIAKLNPDNPEALEAGMQAIERHWDNVIKMTNGEQPDIPWTVPEEKSDGSIEYKVNPSYSPFVSVRPDGSLAFSVDGNQSFYPVPVPYTYKGQTFN